MKKLRFVYLLQAGESNFSSHFHTTWGPPFRDSLYDIVKYRTVCSDCVRYVSSLSGHGVRPRISALPHWLSSILHASPRNRRRRICHHAADMQNWCLHLSLGNVKRFNSAVNTNNRRKRGLQLSGTPHSGLGLWRILELRGIAVKMYACLGLSVVVCDEFTIYNLHLEQRSPSHKSTKI